MITSQVSLDNIDYNIITEKKLLKLIESKNHYSLFLDDRMLI